MSIIDIDVLKAKFESGDIPTGSDFTDLIDTLKNDEAPFDELTWALNSQSGAGFKLLTITPFKNGVQVTDFVFFTGTFTILFYVSKVSTFGVSSTSKMNVRALQVPLVFGELNGFNYAQYIISSQAGYGDDVLPIVYDPWRMYINYVTSGTYAFEIKTVFGTFRSQNFVMT